MFHGEVFCSDCLFVPHAVNICFSASLVLTTGEVQCKLLLVKLPRGIMDCTGGWGGGSGRKTPFRARRDIKNKAFPRVEG